MKNPITEIFKQLSDTELIQCITELESQNGIVVNDGEFRKVVESVRLITNSTTYSTDFLLCQMNIFREGALRFKQIKEITL